MHRGRPAFLLFLSSCLVTPMVAERVTAQQLLDDVDHYCIFDGSTIEEDVYTFDSDREAEDALRRVMRFAGLEPNFVIKAANVPNAAAAIRGSTRLILYNEVFMRRVRDQTRTDWSAISILAHEIAHHLQGHTLDRGGSRPNLELEADKYSGFILQKMGSSLSDARAAMEAIAPVQGSNTHPGKSARLAAIANGWLAAEALERDAPDPQTPAPDPTPQPTPNPAPTPAPTPTYVSRAVFHGDVNAYYITSTNEIVGITPNGQMAWVGRKIPPTWPGFAWMYSTAYVTYGVSMDGLIWSRNAVGQVYQVGYITSPGN